MTKCKFCIILPFWESSVNVHFSFRSDNSPDKILCLQMPQLYPSPVHQQSQHWSCKICILSLSLSKLREQFQKNIHWFSVEKWNRKATVHIFFFFIEHYVCRCPRSTCYQVISSHNNKNANTASLCCPWLWDSYQTNIHCLMLQEWCKFENIYIFLWQKS